MTSQSDKALRFRALHAGPECFVIPNPWDAGSARILTHMGFQALATTSAGLAFALGRRDGAGAVTREEVLNNARSIVEASDLPVSADLENGYGDDVETVAQTVRMASEVGLVGASIEDASGDPAAPIYAFDHAVERIAAAVEAAAAAGFPFTLTARAENHLHGRDDLDDTIARLRAYRAAGADVLYAPGLRTLDAIRAVVEAVDAPVNVVMGLSGTDLRVADLAAAGVRRISLGSALNRAAWGRFIAAAEEVRTAGTFGFSRDAPGARELYAAFGADD